MSLALDVHTAGAVDSDQLFNLAPYICAGLDFLQRKGDRSFVTTREANKPFRIHRQVFGKSDRVLDLLFNPFRSLAWVISSFGSNTAH